METIQVTLGSPKVEMFELPVIPHDSKSFMKFAQSTERPLSVATEFMETDWEVPDGSEFEDDDDDDDPSGQHLDDSPRMSIGSDHPSVTTLSSFEEVSTPKSGRHNLGEEEEPKPVEGPRGPHLFRSLSTFSNSTEFQNVLSLSPITLKPDADAIFFSAPASSSSSSRHSPPPLKSPSPPPSVPSMSQGGSCFHPTDAQLDTNVLSEWAPEMVAQWLLNAGIDHEHAWRFIEHDICGSILLTLKSEDLRQLDIPSFGMRVRIWAEIDNLQNLHHPRALDQETDIEDDIPSPRRVRARREGSRRHGSERKPKRGNSNRRCLRAEDLGTPRQHVSIVGIEQALPTLHNCSKGAECSRNKRYWRMRAQFEEEFPTAADYGDMMAVGDPGNPQTAQALLRSPILETRPSSQLSSEAVPSVVASSDILGAGPRPVIRQLDEASLRAIPSRDAQDNVKQYMAFQCQQASDTGIIPPTPPFLLDSVMSPSMAARPGVRVGAPKLTLTIPDQHDELWDGAPSETARPRSAIPSFIPDSSLESNAEATPAPYRFGTPFSAMDVPSTDFTHESLARDHSQSVPPDMAFRPNQTTTLRSCRGHARNPSFPVLPPLAENQPVQLSSSTLQSPTRADRSRAPPPRTQYPWTPTERKPYELAIPPSTDPVDSSIAPITQQLQQQQPATLADRPSPLSSKLPTDGITCQGPMKKRKIKMLRHEWHEHYFTLCGSRLNMHKDMQHTNKTLEYIDVDDYAIACSTMASSKLSAAFKAMNIKRGAGKDDLAAFSFQLIPQDGKGRVVVKRRDSTHLPPAPTRHSSDEPVNGTGKTHYFAVKSRDERIDWMRELMLAKALKQKGQGYDVRVNGSMI